MSIKYVEMLVLVPVSQIELTAKVSKDDEKIGFYNVVHELEPKLRNNWEVVDYDTNGMDELAIEWWDEL